MKKLSLIATLVSTALFATTSFADTSNTGHVPSVESPTTETMGPPDTHPVFGGSSDIIGEDMVLDVPNDFPDINAAMRSLDDKRIKVGTTVTISVSECPTEEQMEPFVFNHPNGKSIHIIGGTASDLCRLDFYRGVDGFVVSDGNTIGLINGFNLLGTFGYQSSGIVARNGATIKLGSAMRVAGFLTGVRAENNATIIANGIKSVSNTDGGFYSSKGGFIQANNAEASFNGQYGFLAEHNGSIEAVRSTSSLNGTTAYEATTGGYVNASLSSVPQFIPIPLRATSGGLVNAFNVSLSGGFIIDRDERSHGAITDERSF